MSASPDAVKKLVDRGLEIVALQAKLGAELKQINRKLTEIGLASDHRELVDAVRDGRRWDAQGSRAVVPVEFCADLLIKTFKPQSPVHKALVPLAGAQLPEFFRRLEIFEKTEKDGKKFRLKADELLGKAAPKFITACLQKGKGGIPKSGIKIGWKSGLKELGVEVEEEGDEE